MKWSRVSAYCIQCDGYKIAKWAGRLDKYLLSRGEETIGWYDSAGEARKAAERHKKEVA